MVDDMDENELKVLSAKSNQAMKRLDAMGTDRAFIGYLLIAFNLGLLIGFISALLMASFQ